MIVSDGFTDSVHGCAELSPTYSRLTSCDWPWVSTTEVAGSAPIRQLPCMCVVASPDHRICVAPAASSTRVENARAL